MSIVEFSVQKEYEKLPDLKPDDIKQIRDWLKTQPHLPHMYITGKKKWPQFNSEQNVIEPSSIFISKKSKLSLLSDRKKSIMVEM